MGRIGSPRQTISAKQAAATLGQPISPLQIFAHNIEPARRAALTTRKTSIYSASLPQGLSLFRCGTTETHQLLPLSMRAPKFRNLRAFFENTSEVIFYLKIFLNNIFKIYFRH